MQYIKISELKKIAKKERKNNLSLKNHSESLNFIAQKYNFSTWEKLLNHSVLLIKNEDHNAIDLANQIINLILEESNHFYEIFENKNSKIIANYIHKNFVSHTEDDSLWTDKAFGLMRVISFVYCKTTKDIDIKYFHSLLNRDKLIYVIEENYDKFIKNSLIENFLENSCVFYKKPTKENKHPKQNSTFIEQYSYLTMQYSQGFTEIYDAFVELITRKMNKEDVIDIFINKSNIPTLSLIRLFNKNEIFKEYVEQVSGKKVSFFNDDFIAKHKDLLLKLK